MEGYGMQRIMKYSLVFLLLISFFAAASISGAVTPSASQLVIFHTNDTHGHPLKFFNNPADNVGGLPARATLAAQARSQYQNILWLDAGDLNTGRPESNFFKAMPDIAGYNYIGYDAMAMGNHEFDNTLDILRMQMRMAKFPFLSANVKTADGKYIGQPYMMKEFPGFKVAILGLTTREIATVGNPQIMKGLIVKDEVEVAKELVPELRKQADIVIALVHMGIFENGETGSKRLAQNVPGIDLIVDGHSHTQLTEPLYINKTPIVQAWQWGMMVGKAVLTIQHKKVTKLTWEAIPVNLKAVTKKVDGTKETKFIGQEVKEDPFLLSLLQPYGDAVEKALAEPVGTAGGVFSNAESRKQETAIGDLVADSMVWYTRSINLQTDFAIQNGGGVRTDIPEGAITKKTVYSVLPFDNSVAVVTLKGADLQTLFDYLAAIPQGAGAFPQVSEGVKFTINYNTGKCENITINGQPIDASKLYRIATNSYLAAGGDGYQAFLKAVDTYDTSVFQRDALIGYLMNLGKTIQPEIKGRIQIIGSKVARILRIFKLAA
jgi:5'-nucleotidase/UDP-sugar diphosphatase